MNPKFLDIDICKMLDFAVLDTRNLGSTPLLGSKTIKQPNDLTVAYFVGIDGKRSEGVR